MMISVIGVTITYARRNVVEKIIKQVEIIKSVLCYIVADDNKVPEVAFKKLFTFPFTYVLICFVSINFKVLFNSCGCNGTLPELLPLPLHDTSCCHFFTL